jgi:hypothetical protein
MFSFIISFSSILLLINFLSLPILLYLYNKFNFSLVQNYIFSNITTLSILSIFLSNATLLNLNWVYIKFLFFINILFSIFAIFLKFSLFISLTKATFQALLNNRYKISFILITLILLASPSFISFMDFTMIQRFGPDANGPIAAIRFFQTGGTLGELQQSLYLQLNSTSLDQIFNLQKIYTLPSLQEQIVSEFALGSVRHTFPALLAYLHFPLFFVSLFQLVTIFSIYISFLILLIFFVILRNMKIWLQCFIVFVVISNPVYLNLWYEGSHMQIFSILLVLASILIAITDFKEDIFIKFVLLILFFYCSVLIYPDSILITTITFIVFTLTFKFSKNNFYILIIVSMIMAMLNFLFVLRFLDWIPRRLSDAGQAGWPQPFWPDLGSLFGISNPFLNYQPLTLSPNQAQVFFALLVNLFLLFIFYRFISLKSDSKTFLFEKYLFYSFLFIVSLYYFISLNILDLSNYQILKFFGSVSILISFLLLILLLKSNSTILSSQLVFAVLVPLIVLSRASFFYDYFNREHNVNSIMNNPTKFQNQNLLNDSNIILPTNFYAGGLGIWNLSVYFNFNHINRTPSLYNAYFEQHYSLNQPLVILFDSNECQGQDCEKLSEDYKSVEIYEGLRAIEYSPDSSVLKGVKIGDISELFFNNQSGLAYQPNRYANMIQ